MTHATKPLLNAVFEEGNRDIYDGAPFEMRAQTKCGATIQAPAALIDNRVALCHDNGDKTFVADEDVSTVSLVFF
jgi:hypothetical protein